MSIRRPKFLLYFAVISTVAVGSYLIAARKHPDVAAAEESLDRRDFETARKTLDRYLKAHPGDVDARVLAARAARRSGDVDGAAAHLWNVPRHRARHPAVELEQRMIAAQGGDVHEMNSLFMTYVDSEDAPETPAVAEMVALGVLHILNPVPGTGQILPAESAPLLTLGRRSADRWLSLRHRPQDRAAGFVWRGRLSQLAGDHSAALDDLRRAVELDPDSFAAQFHLAIAITTLDPQEAASHMSCLLDRRPDDATVRYSLVNLYRVLGRLDEAGKLLDPLIAANPADVAALVERGSLAVDAGRHTEAEPLLLRAVGLHPDYSKAHLALSRCLHLSGESVRAKQHYDRYQKLEAGQRKAP